MVFLEHMLSAILNCIHYELLKVHYPNYFYANILSNVIGSEKKTAQMIEEAKKTRYHYIATEH